MTRNQKASRIFLVLAIVAALFSPTNILLPAPYWFGLAIVLAGSAWAVRAIGAPAPQQQAGFNPAQASLEALERLRLERNRFFRHSAESPIPDADRESFVALRYYPPTADLIFVVAPSLLNDDTQITLPGSDTTFTRWARLEFTVDDQQCRLTVYMGEDGSTFIPFSDLTTVSETYGGGRYLDLLEVDSDKVLLDFNRAYNPFCAYNPDFICPLPPEENRLAVAIRAGERDYVAPTGPGSAPHPAPAA